MLRHFLRRTSVAIFAALLLSAPAWAQVPSSVPPYNLDLGAIITNTAAGAGTVNSPARVNLSNEGVVCTFNQTAHTGTPSTTIAIQAYDAGTASYTTLAISGAITADTTPTQVEVRTGAVATTVPTGMVIAGLALPRTWRVQEVIGGTTPGVTATIGCNLLR